MAFYLEVVAMRSLSEATPLCFLVALALGCSSSAPETGIFVGTSSGGSTVGGNGAGASGPGVGSGGAPIVVNTGGVGGGGGATGGIEKCVGTSSATTPVPPVLGFLIDLSGSMGRAPDGAPMGTPTKWVSTRDALTTAFTNMADGTGAGLLFYPNVRSGAMPCFMPQVAVPIAPVNMAQRASILMSLQRAMVNGNTPTHDAYKFAVQTVQASTLVGSKYVVLVTDGAPTFGLGCVGDGMTSVDATPIVMESAAALAAGIKTFVVGSPGSEATRTSLSQIASQGGTALPGCNDAGPMYCHFDMTTAPDLSVALNDAFKAITGSIVSCTYTIPAATGMNVVDTSLVNVNVVTAAGKTPVPRATGADCTQGWQFSADMKQINLCPDTCNQVKMDMGARVDVELGCKTITL